MQNRVHKDACRRLVTWALILGGVLLSPGVGATRAHAQQAAPAEAEFLGLEHRQQLYEQSRLTLSGAVGRNLLLPGLGNIYAEQYFYAGLAFSFLVFAASFVSYGLVTEQPEFLWTGAGTAGIAYIGSIGTSIIGVQKYNRERREGLKVEYAPAPGPFAPAWSPGVAVGWRF